MKGKSRLLKPVFASLFATIVLLTCVTPALADVTYTEYASITGRTGMFTVPGATWGDAWPSNPDAPVKIVISFAHYDSGDHGPRDSIYVQICRPPPVENIRVPIAWFTDTTESAELYRAIMTNFATGVPFPTIIPVLKTSQIKIDIVGKRVMLRWTVPLVIEQQSWHGGTRIQAAVTIPPGFVVLEWYGEPSSGGSQPEEYGYSDIYTEHYDARGFLMCPKWRKDKFISLDTPGDTRVIFDSIYTANLPDP